jgi:hypothetical protein
MLKKIYHHCRLGGSCLHLVGSGNKDKMFDTGGGAPSCECGKRYCSHACLKLHRSGQLTHAHKRCNLDSPTATYITHLEHAAGDDTAEHAIGEPVEEVHVTSAEIAAVCMVGGTSDIQPSVQPAVKSASVANHAVGPEQAAAHGIGAFEGNNMQVRPSLCCPKRP